MSNIPRSIRLKCHITETVNCLQ